MITRILIRYPLPAAFLWAVIIFILCATPGRYIPSAKWADLLSIDKLVHAGIFFVLCSLCLLSVRDTPRKTLYRTLWIVTCILYGITLEWMQANIFSERSADLMDIAANTAGCLLAAVLNNSISGKFNPGRARSV